jgi:hypothetical protein
VTPATRVPALGGALLLATAGCARPPDDPPLAAMDPILLAPAVFPDPTDPAPGPGPNATTVPLPTGVGPVRITLTRPSRARAYDSAGTLVLGPGQPSWTGAGGPDLRFVLEGLTWGDLGRLVVEEARTGARRERELVGSPPTVGHPLLPTEEVFVVAVDDGPDWSNRLLVETLGSLLGGALTIVDGNTVDGDVWIQDELEVLAAWAPDGRAELVLDSPRTGPEDGGLDRFVQGLRRPGRGVLAVGDAWDVTTFDSFGNLEATPPVAAGGRDHPLGRVYYGWNGITGAEDLGLHADIRALLDELGAQAPFAVDTSWLCTGHVDEFVTFVPDPDAPRGFRMLYADTALGFELLDAGAAETGLQRHGRGGGRGHHRPTLGHYQRDVALRAYNEDLQRDHLDPLLDVFRQALDLREVEVVRAPTVFEEWVDEQGVCGAVAVVPAQINLLLITDSDGLGGTAIMADPFLRPPGAPLEADPFVRAWRHLLPDTVEPVFVDDWDVYHMAGGEVHCGTNQVRTPALARAGGLDALPGRPR